MAKHAGFARYTYNFGLNLYNSIDHTTVKSSVSKKLTAIKKILTNITKKQSENAWMNELSSKVYQSSFQHLGTAISKWLAGEAKRPVYKSRKDGQSFTVYDGNGVVTLDCGKKIKIPTLGTFRLWESLDARYVTQTFTLSCIAGQWYVCFAVNAERIPLLFHQVQKTIGIDLGVKTFATLSDGTEYSAPKPFKKAKTKLAKKQWRNRKKQSGNRKKDVKTSNNAKKFYQSVAKQHAHIANVRYDFLQKTTTEISRKYSHIRIEDLNVSGMIANHKLASAVSDLGFYEFRRQLTYKSPIYSTKVEIIDRWYPSSKMCHNCHHIQPMPLNERWFKCENCAHVNCRDWNAALNLADAPNDKVRLA